MNVVIVSEDPTIVEFVCSALADAGSEINIARNIQDGWRKIKAKMPQLILLEWRLDDLNALHLLSLIRNDKKLERVSLILLTARNSEDDMIEALERGADDYMIKPFSRAELIGRVRALVRRKTPEHANKPMSMGLITLDPVSGVVLVGDRKANLRRAEFKLLKFLMARPNQVFSRLQLQEQVWGTDEMADVRSVDVHVMRLRKAVRPEGSLIKAVRGVGYLLSEK